MKTIKKAGLDGSGVGFIKYSFSNDIDYTYLAFKLSMYDF